MSFALPPVDLHAHVDVDTPSQALLSLRAVLFVALRSQEEFDRTVRRNDPLAIWGVGIHPGLESAVKSFDQTRLREQLELTPLLSEIGLDRRSQVPATEQEAVFSAALDVHDEMPCFSSVHSAGRTRRILDLLEPHRCSTVVLHWWNGSREDTLRAVNLGCYFSVNTRNIMTWEALKVVPPDRILPETDHPYGAIGEQARPGNVEAVEKDLSQNDRDFRLTAWQNLGRLLATAGATAHLPSKIRGILAATCQ
jgi:TatD DNase family protein